ncbi:hypothetical protein NMY22_g3677 [Coprinellus aureogranulatus]|nr:hypothetical protein NMY22_g3677 [Coprinellus aureogranulatus]
MCVEPQTPLSDADAPRTVHNGRQRPKLKIVIPKAPAKFEVDDLAWFKEDYEFPYKETKKMAEKEKLCLIKAVSLVTEGEEAGSFVYTLEFYHFDNFEHPFDAKMKDVLEELLEL